jgi:hypothetical protein
VLPTGGGVVVDGSGAGAGGGEQGENGIGWFGAGCAGGVVSCTPISASVVAELVAGVGVPSEPGPVEAGGGLVLGVGSGTGVGVGLVGVGVGVGVGDVVGEVEVDVLGDGLVLPDGAGLTRLHLVAAGEGAVPAEVGWPAGVVEPERVVRC